MTEDEAFDRIWGMGKPKTGNWQQSPWPVVRPTRKVLRKAFDNACKGWDLQEFITMIELALQAQQKDRALSLKNRHNISQPVGFAVWLNQERWELEIESAHEKMSVSRETCAVEGCQSQVYGNRFSLCEHHLQFVDIKKDGKLVGSKLRSELNLVSELRNAFDPNIANRPLHGPAALRWAINRIADKVGEIGK